MGLERCLLAAAMVGMAALLVAALLRPVSHQTLAGSTPPRPGDVSCDSRVNSIDAALVLQFDAGLITALSCRQNADVSGDGRVNAVDAALILQYDAGLIDRLGPPPRTPTPTLTSTPAAPRPTLVLDKFGQGTVTSSPAGISCASGCTGDSATFASDTTVVLTASAQAGSALSHWTGCDSVFGSTCRVTMSADRTVLATFEFTSPEIPETTRILDEATMELLLRQEGTTYYFDSDATLVVGLQPGDVIVSGVGDGLLRKVTDLDVGAQEIRVETTAASLEDAIERGTLTFSGQDNVSGGLPAPTSFETAGSVTCVISELRCSVPLNVDLGDVEISGSTSFDVDPDIAVSFDGLDLGCLCFPVREVRSIATFRSEAAVRLFAGAEFSVGADTTIPVATGTWVVFVGPVPVVLQLELGVNVGISGSAEAGIESEASLKHTLTMGGHYLRGSGWSAVTNFDQDFSASEPELTASAEARAFVKPVLTGKVYAVPGPYFGAEGYLRLHADPLETPWWSLYGGLSASAGLETEVFGLTVVDFTLPLWEREWLLDEAAIGPREETILYVGTDGDIYVVRDDGTNGRRLTTDGANSSPRWSPDGRQVAFLHGVGLDRYGVLECRRVEIMAADGNDRRVLIDAVEGFHPETCAVVSNVRWSADGCTVYVHLGLGPVGMHPIRSIPLCDGDPTSSGFTHFFDVRSDGVFASSYLAQGGYPDRLEIGPLDDLDRTSVDRSGAGPVAWSPDGGQLAVWSNEGIDILDETGGLVSSLPPDPPLSAFLGTFYQRGLDWSADGQMIVYEAETGLWLLDLATEETTFLVQGSEPDWEP